MASADVHPQTGSGEPPAVPKLSKTQKKKEKRASKNAKKNETIGDIDSGEQFEQAFRKAQYTQGSYSKSNYKPPAAQDERDDDDAASGEEGSNSGDESVEDIEEAEQREAFLNEGSRQEGMHVKNGVRPLPLNVAELIQSHAWIYRKAWYFGKNKGLVAKIREVNAKLQLLSIDKKYVDEWKASFTDYKRPDDVRTDKENYVNSFKMNDALIDVIVLVAKGLVDWKEQAPRSNTRKTRAKQVMTTMYAQRSALYAMGLPYKSIVDPRLANDIFAMLQEGLKTVDSRLRSNISAWLEGDDRDPTAVQQSLILKAPAVLDTLFSRLRKREPVDDLVKQLEEIRQAIVESNKSMSFVTSDHGLGLDVVRNIVSTLDKASEGDYEGKLEDSKWKYILHLDSQGWKCLVDDTPALKLKTKKQEAKLLSERPKKKLIEYRVPVDLKLDEQIAIPRAGGANEDDDEDGEDGGDDDGDDIMSLDSSATGEQEDGTALPEADSETDLHRERATSPARGYRGVKPASGPRPYTKARAGFSKCTVRGPVSPESPTTELGYIVGGRPIGLLSSRFIVNVGTFENPVHKMISGTEFGRNSGPTLLEKMPLPMPELPSKAKDRHPSDVVSVLSVVEGEPRAKGRPITYYSILWKDEDSAPLWLSRSDLISVCGKAWLDKKTQEVVDERNRVSKNSRSGILEEAWKMDLEYLTDMKSKGLHPDTQKPLRDTDRKTMPWLFQTRTAGGKSSRSAAGEKLNVDEESTTHIKLGGRRFES
jgi:hypothetical protein